MVSPLAPKGRRQQAMGASAEAVREAEAHIDSMNAQASALIGPERSTCLSKVRRYQSDLAALKREVNKATRALTASHKKARDDEATVELFGAGQGMGALDIADGSASSGSFAELNRSTQLLEDSRRVIADTEEVKPACPFTLSRVFRRAPPSCVLTCGLIVFRSATL